MKDFDYIIRGGGCAGLSLAYEMEVRGHLQSNRLAIIEPRTEYRRDKTWSFWNVAEHHHDDCVIGRWPQFTVERENEKRTIDCSALV